MALILLPRRLLGDTHPGQPEALGCALSIDDFGTSTGYFSLASLRLFPLYPLKIDRLSVVNINANTDDAAIISLY